MELLAMAALGAGGYWVYKKLSEGPTYPFESVTGGVTKRPWKTRVVSIQGTGADKITTVQVWAPAGSWGPHLDLLVTTYQQKGSDKNTRVSTGTGPSAIPQMVTAAGQDFGIKNPASGTTVSGAPKPDHKLPLIRYGQRVGTIDVWHNGKADWIWKAHANGGQHLASGKAKTLNGVQQSAAVKTLVAGTPGIGVSRDIYPRDLAFFGGVPGVGLSSRVGQDEPELEDTPDGTIVGTHWSKSTQQGAPVQPGDKVRFFSNGKSLNGRVRSHAHGHYVIKATPKSGGRLHSVPFANVYAVDMRSVR